ncbi:MAG: cytochrome c maturation protein CcmE [Methanobacteriota archaeon]
MDKKVKLVLGVLIVLLSLWAGWGSILEFMTPIKSVDEITGNTSLYINRNIQMTGYIKEGSLQKNEEQNSYKFVLAYENSSINVEYNGALPDGFKPWAGITVIGTLVSQDTFKSHKILIKCPSKYEQSLQERKAKT